MPINQRFIPNLHRKTIISISIFRNQHPYLLFTNSKILNCFVNRQHILLPDWNHLALYSFFYIIYYEHLQIFKIGSTLSANDNPHTIAGSHRQIKMQYRWQVITLPTSVLHRHSNWPDCKFLYNPEVSLLQICFIALCYCHTFCQIFLAPYLCFNVMFQHFFTFTLKRAGTSLRTYLVARHILTSCMQKYSVVKVQRCIISNQWIEREFSDRMLCNFKSQYFCNQLCLQSATQRFINAVMHLSTFVI